MTQTEERGTSTTEPTAFEALARDHYGRLRALAWRFGLNREELDDAVQDVFARAWAAWPRFRGDSDPATWLTRIAINTFTSRRRTWLRRLKHFVRFDGAAHTTTSTASPAEVTDEYARAVACIRRLSPKLRTVLVLRYLEERTAAEVAELLGIPEATVRTRTFHARKRLRALMKDDVSLGKDDG